MSGPDPDPDSVWTRSEFDCDCYRNTWSRTDQQAGWHGEVFPTVTAGGGNWVHCLHTVTVPDQPDAKRYVHCHGSDGPSTATLPTKPEVMAACEQAGTFTDA